jgi:hypothetical protein
VDGDVRDHPLGVDVDTGDVREAPDHRVEVVLAARAEDAVDGDRERPFAARRRGGRALMSRVRRHQGR